MKDNMMIIREKAKEIWANGNIHENIWPNISEDNKKRCYEIYKFQEKEKENILVCVKQPRMLLTPEFSIVFLGDRCYFANNKKVKECFYFNEIENVQLFMEDRRKDGNTYQYGDKIEIKKKDGTYVIMQECLIGANCKEVAKLLHELFLYGQENGVYENSKENMLSEMSEYIKLDYMKIVYNYIYFGEKEFEHYYDKVQGIIVRMDLNPESRNELLEYGVNSREREKTGILVQRMKGLCKGRDYEVVRFSLYQDILNISKLVGISGEQWTFIDSLGKMFEINSEQKNILEKMNMVHNKILERKEESIKKLIYEMYDILKYAKMSGIPESAIFMAGSLYTVDTYKRFRVMSKKREEKVIRAQRELLLSAVVMNMQKQIVNLSKESLAFTLRIINEINMRHENNEKVVELVGKYKNIIEMKERIIKEKEEIICLLYELPAMLPNDMNEIERKVGSMGVRVIRECYDTSGNLLDTLPVEKLRKVKALFDKVYEG